MKVLFLKKREIGVQKFGRNPKCDRDWIKVQREKGRKKSKEKMGEKPKEKREKRNENPKKKGK